MTSSFSTDYLAAAPAALPFLPLNFRREDHRRTAVEQAGVISREVLAGLRALNAQLPPSPAREAHLDALEAGAACVVTGQQVGLFGGPLYTVHKTLSAVAAARALSESTGRPVVPVFWVQCEDHDFAEIASVGVPRPDGTHRELTIDCPGDDRVPVAQRELGPPIEAVLQALTDELRGLPHADEVALLMRTHYRPERTIASAFSQLVAALFAGHGVVLADPRHPALAPLTAPLHQQALLRAPELAQALTGRVAELTDAGYDVQVHVRPDAPLAFYQPDGPHGPRFRLAPSGDAYQLVGDDRRVTRDELLAALADDARLLSTSALLRPLLQDTLLPTAAYVGGPGELNYFGQLQPLYQAFGRPMPLFVPRGRFRLLDRRTSDNLAALGLTPDDLTRPRPELVARVGAACASGHQSPDQVQARLLEPVAGELEAFSAVATDLDPGLAKAVQRTADQVQQSIAKLVAKYARTLAQRDEAALAKVDRAAGILAPGGAPQERVYGLPWFAARFGIDTVLSGIETALVPFDPQLKDVLL